MICDADGDEGEKKKVCKGVCVCVCVPVNVPIWSSS